MLTWTYLLPSSDRLDDGTGTVQECDVDPGIADKVRTLCSPSVSVKVSAAREPMPGGGEQTPGRLRHTRVLPLGVSIQSSGPGTVDVLLNELHPITSESRVHLWLFRPEQARSPAGRVSLLLDRGEISLADDWNHFRWRLLDRPIPCRLQGRRVLGVRFYVEEAGSAELFMDALRVGQKGEFVPVKEKTTNFGSLTLVPRKVTQDASRVRLVYTAAGRVPEGALFRLIPPKGWWLQTGDERGPCHLRTTLHRNGEARCIPVQLGTWNNYRKEISFVLGERMSRGDRIAWEGRHPVWTEGGGSGEKCFRLYLKLPQWREQRLLEPRPTLIVKAKEFQRVHTCISSPGRQLPAGRDGARHVLKIAARDASGNLVGAGDRLFNVRILRDNELIHQVGGIGLTKGHRKLRLRCEKPGLYCVRVEGHGGNLQDESFVSVNGQEALRPYFGYLHTHSDISNDGRESANYCYREGLRNAGLDFCAITDHLRYDRPTWFWEYIQEVANRYNRDHQFVTFPGYEWSSQDHGDRNVYFKQSGPQCEMNGIESTPRELFDSLAGHDAIVIPHATAYELRTSGTNWDYHDPKWERLVELYSCHGASEMIDGNPYPLRSRPMVPAVGPNTVQSALANGARLGFIAGGDNHRRPLPYDPSYFERPTGIAGVWAEELTRDAVWEALYQRRTFASTGARCALRFTVNGHWMGETVGIPVGEKSFRVTVTVTCEKRIKRIELVRNNRTTRILTPAANPHHLNMAWQELTAGSAEFLYVRVRLADNECAWSSPFWLEPRSGA